MPEFYQLTSIKDNRRKYLDQKFIAMIFTVGTEVTFLMITIYYISIF